ncbi:MAG: superoxide dismutase family protein [Sphingobium sp.]
MPYISHLSRFALMLSVAACLPAQAFAMSTTRSGSEPMQAALLDGTGAARGTVTLIPEGAVVHVSVSASGLTPGMHGLHVHAVGKCDGPAFTTAGGHWNPDNKQHGHDNPMGPHRGDLPQLMVGPDGTGTGNFDVAAPIADMVDVDGAAVIIHAVQDDEKTDPSGNSGARLLCAAFVGGAAK